MKVSGTAIHSGVTTTVTLHRHDGPLTFRRAGALIEATVRNVVNAQRANTSHHQVTQQVPPQQQLPPQDPRV